MLNIYVGHFIHMNFGLEHCSMDIIIIKLNGDIIQGIGDGETYKYLGFQQTSLLENN